MTKVLLASGILLSVLAILACSDHQPANVVTRVVDGDTIVINTDTRIDLAYIDAPEREQPFGREAKQRLSDLVLGKPIDFTRSESQQAVVMVDRQSVNKALVIGGYAWRSRDIKSLEQALSFDEFQRQAQQDQRGVWAMPHALRIPPWQWREQGQHKGR